jgi:sec-independent protein translocase protein TatA
MPSGPEWIIVLVVVLVIFGGSQLPKLAKNLGKAQKEFKDGLAEGHDDKPTDEPKTAAQLEAELAVARQEAAEAKAQAAALRATAATPVAPADAKTD